VTGQSVLANDGREQAFERRLEERF
jgi:hypothetical protein